LPWIVCTLALVLAYVAGMCLSLWLVGVGVISVLLFFVALVEACIALYLWICVVSLHQLMADEQWFKENGGNVMEMRMQTKYSSVPANER